MKSWLPLFKRVICGYQSEDESMNVLNSSKAKKLGDGFAIYKYGKTIEKFKQYRFELKQPFKQKEVVATREDMVNANKEKENTNDKDSSSN